MVNIEGVHLVDHRGPKKGLIGTRGGPLSLTWYRRWTGLVQEVDRLGTAGGPQIPILWRPFHPRVAGQGSFLAIELLATEIADTQKRKPIKSTTIVPTLSGLFYPTLLD